jgi:hypothetical protein
VPHGGPNLEVLRVEPTRDRRLQRLLRRFFFAQRWSGGRWSTFWALESVFPPWPSPQRQEGGERWLVVVGLLAHGW